MHYVPKVSPSRDLDVTPSLSTPVESLVKDGFCVEVGGIEVARHVKGGADGAIYGICSGGVHGADTTPGAGERQRP